MNRSAWGKEEAPVASGGQGMKTQDIDLYREVFTGARDAIIVVEGRRGCVVDANSAAAELLGYEPGDLVGKYALDLFPRDEHQAMGKFLDQIWDSAGTHGTPCSLMTIDGDSVTVNLSAHIVGDDEKAYMVAFATGITDDCCTAAGQLRARNEELEKKVAARTAELTRANEELQKSSHEANRNADDARNATKAKSRFIANLTHELRTPLNALIGMSGLLTEMELSEEPREAAQIVADSARGLLGLVNDVLDFAKIEAGKMELHNQPFHFEKALQGVTDIFALQVRQKDLSYSLKLDRKIPTRLVGDEGRLRQILINLVGNALKFTEEGGVTVEIRQEKVHGHRVKLQFSVIDTGCGIAEADLPHLFEAFTQVGETGPRHTAGTGLGLTISRELVERMGGRLEVTSQEGWGSNFSFTLQLEMEDEKKQVPAVAPQPDPVEEETGRMRVLVAEDNKVNQKVALGMMRKLKLTGVAADNGQHALELLAAEKFDLVFMDLQMPELGGLETTRKIRVGGAGEHNKDIPIIAMTGHATRQDRKACLKAGMNGYVTKPISSERIQEAIDALDSPAAASGHGGVPFTMAALVAQMNGDGELALEILEIFRDDTTTRLQRVAEAVHNYDFESVSAEAQAIEGGALNVCAEIIVNLANELHRAASNKEQEYASSLVAEMAAELAEMTADS